MVLVKITHDDDGYKIDEPKWCYSILAAGSATQLCEGQVYGLGESDVKYKVKVTGKVTCPHCIAIIKELKAVKL